MFTRFFGFVLAILMAVIPASIFAVSADTSNSLRIVRIQAVDANAFDIVFSHDIEVPSVRVSVIYQSTRDTVVIDGYEGTDDARAVRVKTRAPLETSTAYVLTVNTAISKTSQTISAGVDAIRDFVTPAEFAGATGMEMDMTVPVEETPVIEETLVPEEVAPLAVPATPTAELTSANEVPAVSEEPVATNTTEE